MLKPSTNLFGKSAAKIASHLARTAQRKERWQALRTILHKGSLPPSIAQG
ncbi:hypothetical protein ACUZ9P_11980 [Desulfovibrio sp. QI0430]